MGLKTLIVDDDNIHCFLHESLISKTEVDVTSYTFKNGKEAFDYLTTNDDGEDVLILLDINMPVMNGWQFLDEINKHSFQSNIKVAIVTSSVDKADKVKATDYKQLVGYFHKPLLEDSVNDFDSLNQSRLADLMRAE